jgi:hypothetical protein
MILNFSSNGPVKVSREVFTLYKGEKRKDWSNFDQMFYDWVDEKNPDEIRRLLIRDMLRQSHGSNRNNKNIFYETNHGFSRILHVGGGSKKEGLYWTLYNRPKLLTEIVEEFLYDLKHDLVSLESIGESGRDELIEFLTSLTDTTDARRLLAYHPINQKRLSYDDKIACLFHLWTPHTRMPEWFRNEIWPDVESAVKTEIAGNKEAIIKNKSMSFSYDRRIKVPAIQAMREFIRNQSFVTGKNFHAIVPCLWVFEKELPKDVTYCSLLDTVRLAIQLKDEELALKFARRHTVAVSSDDMCWFNSREGRVFLYWLRGIAAIFTPDDQELFGTIENILRAIGEEK